MIQIEPITEIPDLKWTAHSYDEITHGASYKKMMVERTKEMYLLSDVDGPIMVIGLTEASMITGFRLWCLVCQCDLLHHARLLRRLLASYVRQLGHLTVTVDKEFKTGLRFAEFMGFDLADEVASIDRKVYCVYEMGR